MPYSTSTQKKIISICLLKSRLKLLDFREQFHLKSMSVQILVRSLVQGRIQSPNESGFTWDLLYLKGRSTTPLLDKPISHSDMTFLQEKNRTLSLAQLIGQRCEVT